MSDLGVQNPRYNEHGGAVPAWLQDFALHALISAFISLVLAAHGLRKNSLSITGAIAAVIVGFWIMCAGVRFGVALIVFYLLGSALTKFKKEVKARLENNFEGASRRTAVQVFSNAGVAALICISYLYSTMTVDKFLLQYVVVDADAAAAADSDDGVADTLASALTAQMATKLAVAFVAAIACCCGDTCASELGILSKASPVLATAPWRVVPPGTNGGVTPLGLIVSTLGGGVVGVAFFVTSVVYGLAAAPSSFLDAWTFIYAPSSPLEAQLRIVVVAAAAGLVGSVVDSLLGATVQYSAWCGVQKIAVEHPTRMHGDEGDVDVSDDETNAVCVVCAARGRPDRVGLTILQYTRAERESHKHICGRDWLDNHQVNLLSSLITAVIFGVIVAPIVF
jgi:uncharacterized membrane protein